MNIIQAMNRLRSDIQTWVANNLKVKVNAELKTDSTEEYKVLSDNNFTDADKDKVSNLATVATSGSYNDLINKPTIPPAQVNSDWNATSGVSQILNKPTIPDTNTVSNWGFTKTNGTVTKVSTGDGLTGGDITATGTINLKTAATGEIGGIKAGSVSTTSSGANKTINANKFAVHVDKDGLGYVAIPEYSNNSGDITEVVAGNGLTGGATSGNATLNVGAGVGITVSADAVAVDIKDTTKNSKAAVKGGNSDKLYAVELDKNGDLAVSVPWTATTFEGNDELEALLEPFALKTDLDAYKTKQTAITSPTTTNSTSTEFIDTISQDANGVITATKKKLPTYTNVTDGTVSGWGYMKQTAADSTYAKKSDLPTVNDAKLTIQKNGTEVGTFTANQSSAKTINITVPTKVSDLSDGSSYATQAYVDQAVLDVATGGTVSVPVEDVQVNGTSVVVNKVAQITVPTVNNGKITIKQNGTEKGSFTLNQSGNGTIELTDSTYSATDANPSLTWGTKSKVATVCGTDIHVTMPANPNTDVSCTESGHYSPSTEASANKQSAGSGKYISGIKLDSKKHIVGIETGSLPTFTEQYKGTVTGIKINGSTKSPSNGIVDLGTVITEQDVPTHTGQLVANTLLIDEDGLTVDYSDAMTIAKFNADGSTELKNIKTLDGNGNIVFEVDETGVNATNIELNGEPIEDLVDRKIEDLATENYVLTEIAKAQLAGTEIDLSGFATKDDLDSKISTINGVEPTDGNVNITDNMIVRYAVCNSAADSALKAIEIEDYTHIEGSRILILLNNGSTVTPSGLRVNNSTTGIQYCGNALPTGTTFPVAHILELTFGRGVWNITGGYQKNDYINGVRTLTNSNSATNYGVCDTAANATDKVVSISAAFSLVAGAQVVVKFNKGNTVTASFTLNVNGTGAKNILWGSYSGARRMPVNAILTFVYDGTYWCCKTSNAALTSGSTDLGYALQVLNTDSCGLAIAKNQSVVNGQGDLHIHHGSNENAIYCSGGNIVTDDGCIKGTLIPKVEEITTDVTLTNKANLVLYTGSGGSTVTLPTSPQNGQKITIINPESKKIYITSSNHTIRHESHYDNPGVKCETTAGESKMYYINNYWYLFN